MSTFQLLNSCYFLPSELSINNRFSQCHWDENKQRKDLKSSWLFLVLPQPQCGSHRAQSRSDGVFSKSFLRESYSGSLTSLCSLSLSPSAVATWICGRVNWTGRITSVLQNHFLSAVNTSASHWRVGWCRVRAVAYRAQLLPLSAAYRASTSKRNTIYLQWMHRLFVM